MTAPTPSQTARGRAWLTNFATVDQSSMALLLDSLHIADSRDVRSGLKSEIAKLEPLLDNGTGYLVPVLSIDDINRVTKEQSRLRADGSQRMPGPLETEVKHTAWHTYHPGMPISVTPGSEGSVGSLIRDVTGDSPGKEPSQWLHPGNDLDLLRDRRCRLLVLVTDYSGSGAQAARFAQSFVRHPRVRSWRSFHWLRIIVVAYAISAEARRVLEDCRAVDQVRAAMPAPSFANAEWTSAERASIENICRHYLPPRQRKNALGFNGSAGLFLTDERAPNNLPTILRRQAPGWKPFLIGEKGRVVPQDLIGELKQYRPPDRDISAVVKASNQQRLARAIKSGRLRTPADRLVALLALLAHRTYDPPAISYRLGRPEGEVNSMIDFLKRVGLLSADLTVTTRGREELRCAKRLDRVATAHLVGSDDPYYPRALR